MSAFKGAPIPEESQLQALIEKGLALASAQGATQAEIGLQVGLGQDVSVRQGAIETVEYHRSQSFGVTVYIGQQKGSASTNDFSEASLQQAVEAAVALARLTQADPYAGLAEPADLAVTIPKLDLHHPWELSTEALAEIALKTEGFALDHDERITQSEGASISTGQQYHAYGNTHGFLAGYWSARHSSSCVVIGRGLDGAMERDYEFTVARNPKDLWTPKRVGRSAAEKTLARLNPKTVPTQKVPVLFDASIAAGFLGHFTSAISGGALFRQASFLCDSLGERVFPLGFRLYEDPYLIGALGSSPFDNDGVATKPRDLVFNGRVESYILSAYSARRLGLPNTGNAGGISNILIDYPKEPLKELLKRLGKGLWVTELMGQGVHLITGDYSRGAAGFWVENGEVQFPVSGVTIAGNLRQLYAGIIGLGDDIDQRHSIQTGSILVDELMVAGS